MTNYENIIKTASPEDVPLINTTMGNLPVESLEYKTDWIINSEYIMFTEKWLYEGIQVKSNAHAYSLKPLLNIGATIPEF